MIIPQKLLGDCRDVLLTLPENHFHLCVTSPPYWRLRSYLPADHPLKAKEIGQEPDLGTYICNIVEVFRLTRRVLRPDGSLWLNLGDLYANDKKWGGKSGGKNSGSGEGGMSRARYDSGLKSKNLFMLPARVAMALQADGWTLRAMCPWIKRNVNPESVKDRPPVAIEYVFMFTKGEHCYYDWFPIQIPSSPNTHPKNSRFNKGWLNEANSRLPPKTEAVKPDGTNRANSSFSKAIFDECPPNRMRRNSDWLMEAWEGLLTAEDEPLAFIVNTKGTSLGHFAAYPPKLVRPIVLACTSEAGCCKICGAPLRRITEKPKLPDAGKYGGKYSGKEAEVNRVVMGAQKAVRAARAFQKSQGTGEHDNPFPAAKHIRWDRGCECESEIVPCRVLDPFNGTGTTGEVAVSLGRDYTGIELNPEYFAMSDVRDGQSALL